jgi:hypothetical protein
MGGNPMAFTTPTDDRLRWDTAAASRPAARLNEGEEMNGRSSREWLVPLLGVAFLVVLIISFIVQGEPKDADRPASEIVDWYVDNKDAVEISAVIAAIAGLLLVFFGAYLRRFFDAAAGGTSMLPILVLIGLSIVAVAGAIDSTILFATAEAADHRDNIDPSSIQTMQALWDNDFVPFILGTNVFLWSVGILTIRTGALPKWLGWVAILLGIVGFTPIGFAAAIGAAVWILIVSILLSVRTRREVAAPAAAA